GENVESLLSVFFRNLPLLLISSVVFFPFTSLRFLDGVLPSKPRSGDHWPKEMEANGTSHQKTQVQALSGILRSRPPKCGAPTLLCTPPMPPGQQSRQSVSLAPQAPQPRLLPRPHPCGAGAIVAPGPPGILATPDLTGTSSVTRILNAAR